MFLKNYTSDVPVTVTIERIEKVLIRCGMTAITKEYGTRGEVAALRFQLKVGKLPEMSIRLPVDINAATEALWRDYVGSDSTYDQGDNEYITYGNKKKKRKDFVEQGQRTAWKIAQDWLEIEMSRMQLKQGDPREVFLAYIWDGRETIFQRIERSGFRALLPETTEAA